MENKENNRKHLSVVGAAILNKNKILCAQRGYGSLKGKWEFPGGKIESGETPEEALIREIHEELDVSIKIDNFIEQSDYSYPTFDINLKVYLCHIEDGVINDHEHEALKWFSKDEMKGLDWCPADVPILNKILEE